MKSTASQVSLISPASHKLIKPTHTSTAFTKHALDNRSRQLYPENDAYWHSRHLPRPEHKSKAQ